MAPTPSAWDYATLGMNEDQVEIDVSLVRRLIATQYPQWANLVIEPVAFGGWDNRTFHLGASMVVRLPSAVRYSLQVEKEQRWLPRLAPFLPLPIPAPLVMGRSGEGYPWHWSVYRWLDGETAAAGRIAGLRPVRHHFSRIPHRPAAYRPLRRTTGGSPQLSSRRSARHLP